MIKEFTSLGLMSGTSGDGVDASVILSDGNNNYELILDRYYEYDLKDIWNVYFLILRLTTRVYNWL